MKWSIRNRRIAALFATVSLLVVWLAGAQWIRISLGQPAVYSGTTLLVCLVGLMLIGLRKRLVILPLWSVSTWVQVHIYTGLFASVAFVAHVPKIFASGPLEAPLSWLFLIVAASGFYGVFISRTAPKRLTGVSIQPRYDRIAWHRDQIAFAATQAIAELKDTPDRNALKAFFDQALGPYFVSSLAMSYLVYPSSTRRRRLLTALAELDRYLDANVLAASKRLAALIRHRDDLDYQHAIQFRLRAWIVVHGGLSSVLMVWSLVHAYIAIGMLGT